jgi:hypothetical protein
MKNSELKEYLNTFPDDSEVKVIIANPKIRKSYPLTGYFGITDTGNPEFILEVGVPENMDEPDGDIEGQTDFNDFPEVLP